MSITFVWRAQPPTARGAALARNFANKFGDPIPYLNSGRARAADRPLLTAARGW